MNAILLANGGDGQLGAPILGERLLVRTARQLARAGVRRLTVALRPGDTAPVRWLGEASIPGLGLCFREVEEGLGTAGAVRICAQPIQGEGIWVVEGGALQMLELAPVAELHRARKAAVTLAMTHSSTPQRCTAVAANRLGQVVYLEEKPPLARCQSVAVSSGVSLFSRDGLEQLPQTGDLNRDLFPRLMDAGELYAAPSRGFWRLLESPRDLLDCATGLLSGEGDWRGEWFRRRPGLYSVEPLPENVDFIPPCWVGQNVRIGAGSLIGPYAVLEEGTAVGPRSLVQHSYLNGASVGGCSTLYGAVLCRGARAGEGCTFNDGVVVGRDAVVADGTVLGENSLYFL